MSSQFAASANRGFQFQKRTQLFIRVHNVTLSVVAMCVIRLARMAVKGSFPIGAKALLIAKFVSRLTQEA
ncbi:MAG: hypothetical protein DME61_11655 [Verrucomicrobia bacterium]|nr:MAG: hypothetical protein DME61_11655 [Verrucomicrobiota bacterium]